MSIKSLFLGLTLASTFTASARAEDVFFSVTGTVYDATMDQYNRQPGTISGELLGLNPNGTSFPTLIVINSEPGIFDLPNNFPIDPNVPTTNQGVTDTSGAGFTITDGKVTAADADFSYTPSGYGGMQAAAELDFGKRIYSTDSEYPGPTFAADGGFSAVKFTPALVVPEPSEYLLLILGAAALFVRRRLFRPAPARE